MFLADYTLVRMNIAWSRFWIAILGLVCMPIYFIGNWYLGKWDRTRELQRRITKYRRGHNDDEFEEHMRLLRELYRWANIEETL